MATNFGRNGVKNMEISDDVEFIRELYKHSLPVARNVVLDPPGEVIDLVAASISQNVLIRSPEEVIVLSDSEDEDREAEYYRYFMQDRQLYADILLYKVYLLLDNQFKAY